MNDESEIVELSCDKCKNCISGTYRELFGNLLGLAGVGKMKCKCGGTICIKLTGRYK